MMRKILGLFIVIIAVSAIIQLIPSRRAEPLIANETCPRLDNSNYPISRTDNGFELSLTSKGFPLEYYNETQANYCETLSHIDASTDLLLLVSNILILSVPVSGLIYFFARRK